MPDSGSGMIEGSVVCSEPGGVAIGGKFSVLVAARDGSHRSTIARYFEKRGIDVTVTDCAATALAIAQSGVVDLMVTGPAMPGLNGYELTRELRQRLPEFPVILLSAGGSLLDEPLLDCALSVGAQAAQRPGASRHARKRAQDKSACHALLTPRERQVMELVTLGHGNKSAALLLCVSPRTIENHRAQIMRKTNTRNVAELVRVAMMQVPTREI